MIFRASERGGVSGESENERHARGSRGRICHRIVGDIFHHEGMASEQESPLTNEGCLDNAELAEAVWPWPCGDWREEAIVIMTREMAVAVFLSHHHHGEIERNSMGAVTAAASSAAYSPEEWLASSPRNIACGSLENSNRFMK